MPLPSDPAYYADCFDLFAKALLAPHGVQKVCTSWDEAYQFRQRLHKARALSRELSKRAFGPDHPLHNTSEYYGVVARIVFDEKRGVWLLRLEKRELKNEEIEEIMPAEIEVVKEEPTALWGGRAVLAASIPIEPDKPSVIEDEFALQPESDLGPSPDGAPRVRRL
jgi:hypothetical protein